MFHLERYNMWTPEKRHRVPQACDQCKRRKKQCSGSHPCATCTAKSITCSFSSNPLQSDHSRNIVGNSTNLHKTLKKKAESLRTGQRENPHTTRLAATNVPLEDSPPEDETPIQNPGRLLQDGEGRLLYLGDSATLSFLQSIRRLVEKRLGPSPFTLDSSRSKILEATISNPVSIQHNYALPDRETAQFMIDSFFANTAGLFDIFDKASFDKMTAETFEQPLNADPQWLCQLNLVFAVGLQMRKDSSIRNTKANKILEKLEGNGVKRAERFYLAARQLKDPTIEFEEGGITVVQSLLLMTIYMLAASKRNAAWGYLGMAINLSYALGIHKEETLPMFDPSEQAARRNLWQSLYVMDCFLAMSLGRPNAINCETASELCSTSGQHFNKAMSAEGNSLFFTVKASKIVGEILSRVYHKRKASRSIAYHLSVKFNEWIRDIPPELHWRGSCFQVQDPDLTLERLHINLIYFNGIILLTRPFLLYRISRQLAEPIVDSTSRNTEQPAHGPGTERGLPEQAFCFHGACVRSALHSITAINAAFSINALPRRDPFVIYWLFSAALVILANIFCPVYDEAQSESVVHMALKIIRFCGDADPQARRYQTILESFTEVLQEDKKTKEQITSPGYPGQIIFNMLFGNEVVGINGEMSLTESRMPTASAAPLDWVDGRFPPNSTGGLDTQYFTPGIQGKDIGSSSWMEDLAGKSDDSIDGNGIWWNAGQDIFTTSGDIRVPLYGLMEPT